MGRQQAQQMPSAYGSKAYHPTAPPSGYAHPTSYSHSPAPAQHSASVHPYRQSPHPNSHAVAQPPPPQFDGDYDDEQQQHQQQHQHEEQQYDGGAEYYDDGQQRYPSDPYTRDYDDGHPSDPHQYYPDHHSPHYEEDGTEGLTDDRSPNPFSPPHPSTDPNSYLQSSDDLTPSPSHPLHPVAESEYEPLSPSVDGSAVAASLSLAAALSGTQPLSPGSEASSALSPATPPMAGGGVDGRREWEHAVELLLQWLQRTTESRRRRGGRAVRARAALRVLGLRGVVDVPSRGNAAVAAVLPLHGLPPRSAAAAAGARRTGRWWSTSGWRCHPWDTTRRRRHRRPCTSRRTS